MTSKQLPYIQSAANLVSYTQYVWYGTAGMEQYQIAGNFLGQLISIVHGGWDRFCWIEGGSIYIVLKPQEINRRIWLRDIFNIGKREINEIPT